MSALGRVPTIGNLTLTNQNTEYSYPLPRGTLKFTVRCRTESNMKIAYTEGDSGLAYINIPAGADHFEEKINVTGLYLYLQSPTASVVVEIVSWAT